jgi:peptidoglycan/xylan/chitin deacetylase (PgdA/CDA1 family)
MLRKNLDWIQIIPHGLTHFESEFAKAEKETVKLALKAIDDIFTKDKIKYEKGFKAPYWQWNQDVVDVLDEEGWWGAVDPRIPMLCTKKFYKYDYLTCEPFWVSEKEVLKLHGHIDGKSDNDIEKSFLYLMKMPVDAEFHFVTDYLEDK